MTRYRKNNWNDTFAHLHSVEYSYGGPDVRITVLSLLVDYLVSSVREVLLSEKYFILLDHCRIFNTLGELTCCETCPAVYHLGCIDPPLKEDDDPPFY